MTIMQAITQLGNVKPHMYDQATLVRWLSNLDGLLFNDIVKRYKYTAPPAEDDTEDDDTETEETTTGQTENPFGWTTVTGATQETQDTVPHGPYNCDDDMDTVLMVPEPYSDIYIYYMMMQIDFYQAEMARYNNDVVMYNQAMNTYADWYAREHEIYRPNHIQT